jgi:RNA polymerase sporulation-specific sigma factor
MESLSEKERNFLKWSFGLDGEDKLTQKEIGDKLGISQPVISRYRKKVLGKLKVEMRAKF